MKASAAVSTSCSYLAFQALSAIALTPRSVQTARTSLNIMNSFHTSRNTIFKNMCIISSLNDVSRRRSGHTALFFLRQNCEIRTNRCKSTTVFSNAVRTLNHGLGDENTQILSSDIPVVYEAELIVKKSQFIGYASHCSSWPDAQRFLSNIKSLHPKARHLCYGFIGGGGGVSTMTERCSDDGEPTGTAGLPILGEILSLHALWNGICFT
uniref:Impact N-terminal domain-containing protein n=1 Tax=Corethron hystrix TaxID=216773 RepID=A0A7S1BDL5_9STRA|mmetsp:Transcript_22752/g.52141  ORF Transcript_22752/g.52141 Transcript_22752/m.52141 type:complete len:210 (+) Transcript_22752:208-837(+)